MYVSIRDATLLAAGFPTLAEGLRAVGLQAIELAVDSDLCVKAIRPDGGPARLSLRTDAGVEELRRHLDDAGAAVSTLLLPFDFDRPAADQEVARMARAVEAAAGLGVPVVRIGRAAGDSSAEPSAALQQSIAGVAERVLRATAGCDVDLAIENHGPAGNDPAFLQEIFDRVGDSRLGLSLDVGDPYWSGEPLQEVYEVLEKLTPLAKHTHVRNFCYPTGQREQIRPVGWKEDECVCPLEEGDIDLLTVHDLLRDAGYDRDLCIEDDSLARFEAGRRAEILREDVQYLDRIIGSG